MSALYFLLGIVIAIGCATLRNLLIGGSLLLILTVMCYFFRRSYNGKPILCLCAGYLYLSCIAYLQLHARLPVALEGKPLQLIGKVSSLPQVHDQQLSFTFDVQQILSAQQTTTRNLRVLLRWYGAYPNIQLDQRWLLPVKLKRPHALANPPGATYATHALQQHIHAMGYVTATPPAIYLGTHSWGWGHLRQTLRAHLDKAIVHPSVYGLINALILGEQSAIPSAQWTLFRNTGTSHLVAISGLHIGLVATTVFAAVIALWRYLPFITLRLNAVRVAAFCALFAAWCYSGLAGFSIPTQRAVVMIAVYMGGLLCQRHVAPGQAFRLALFVVLLVDPLVVLNTGFWLSFAAVALLIYASAARLQRLGKALTLLRIQYALTLGLAPFTLYWFQQISLIGFLANCIAIPWIGMLVVPLCLCAALLSLCAWSLAQPLFAVTSWLLQYYLVFLQYLSQLPGGVYYYSIQHPAWLLVAILGIVLWLAPSAVPARWLSLLYLTTVLGFSIPPVPSGAVRLTVLDVGQGLACVLQTRHHLAVYDTGPPLGPSADAGGRVILPFIRYWAVRKIDHLIISHRDNDHSGGAQSLLHALPVSLLSASAPQQFATWPTQLCEAGGHWRWDQVDFAFLYPDRNRLGLGNNSSCVLKVTAGGQSILLSGDIEAEAERTLVRQQPDKLSAVLLVAPHHGSKTSSSAPFVAAVKPKLVIFATGYKNRFRFPAANILARYQDAGALLYNTAQDGAVSITLPSNTLHVTRYHSDHRHVWD